MTNRQGGFCRCSSQVRPYNRYRRVLRCICRRPDLPSSRWSHKSSLQYCCIGSRLPYSRQRSFWLYICRRCCLRHNRCWCKSIRPETICCYSWINRPYNRWRRFWERILHSLENRLFRSPPGYIRSRRFFPQHTLTGRHRHHTAANSLFPRWCRRPPQDETRKNSSFYKCSDICSGNKLSCRKYIQRR